MSLRFAPFLFRAALALPLFVSACALPLVPPPQGAAATAPATEPQAGTAPAPVKPPVLRREGKLEGPAPETLIGSDQNAIMKLVGAPGLVRKERGVDVWQYAEETCVLNLYFYDDKAGARKLTYLEALPKGGGDATSVTPAGCLSDQIRAFKTKDLG